MRLVHFSDLHLGFRQYQRLTPGGVNQREADVAATFRTVIDRVIALRPDVILMDLAMPVLDGWEATRRIRGDLRTHHIPVIALTGHGLRRHVDRSVEAGCTAFVPKPCARRPLLEAVARALARRGPLGVVVSPLGDVGSGPAHR